MRPSSQGVGDHFQEGSDLEQRWPKQVSYALKKVVCVAYRSDPEKSNLHCPNIVKSHKCRALFLRSGIPIDRMTAVDTRKPQYHLIEVGT